MSVIVNLLVKSIPNLRDMSSQSGSAEYCAMEWLNMDFLDNGRLFTNSDNGTYIESLVQRFLMAVIYFESIVDTDLTQTWLSPNSTCDWDGIGCNVNGGTSITSLSLSGNQNCTASLLHTFASHCLICTTLSFRLLHR
jgi:hypothetical protein